MTCTRYDEEYVQVKGALRKAKFEAPHKSTMESLTGILQDEGPKHSLGGKLDRLREKLAIGNEAEAILKTCGIVPGSNKAPEPDAVKKVAAMKFLRHLYMLKESGAQKVWLYTSPKAYARYTWDEIAAAATSTTGLGTRLNQTEEVFSDTVKTRLADATREGAVWVAKTLILLAKAKSKKAAAKAMVDRWFAPAEADYLDAVDKLTRGFKAIKSTLNENNVVITDHPPDRTNPAKDLTEAYVYGSVRPRAIYIEKALMKNYDVSVLHDMKKNWARTIVHECTHLDAATDDAGGYAWGGIKPGTKVTAANAIKNADNWAFFAADCAGVLTDGERTRAMMGTGGDLTVHPSNWT